MSHRTVHNMDTAWTSSNPAALQVTIDNQIFVGEGPASNRLAVLSGALNDFIEFIPAAALNLSAFEELRFWISGNRPAEGSTTRPFYLEFSYTDASDAPGEEHRWFVPINQAGQWEQRRIGIANDRRSAVTRLRFRCSTALPFVCYLDELLAVHEEMLADLEQALVTWLDAPMPLPGLTNVALSQPAGPGNTQIVLPLTPDFQVDNRILIRGGSAGDEVHQVISVTHNTVAGTTSLSFAATDTVAGNMPANTTLVSVVVPAIVETPPLPTVAPSPAIIVTHIDAREDLERTGYMTQRDSFRPRGVLTVCSVRPAARAYLIDYQIIVEAPTRAQQLFIDTQLLQRLSMDVGLRVNGVTSPVWILPPPALLNRQPGRRAPVYVRFGTRMETVPRQEQPWVRHAELDAAPIDAPLEQEGIVLDF